MNVLMDLTHIPLEKTGVGIYAVNLVSSIAEFKNDNIYFILIQDDERSFENITKKNFIFIKVSHKIFRKMVFRFILEQFLIPLLILKYKIDIVHSFHYSLPIVSFNAKRVVTVHDMTFFMFPEYHEKLKTYYFRFITRISVRLAHRIITVSKSTRHDLIRILGVSKKKIRVIHLGKPGWDDIDVDNKNINKVKKQYGLNGDYFLYMGTIEPRKNLNNLIIGFNQYLNSHAGSGYTLAICGKKGWKYKNMFEEKDVNPIYEHVRFTGYINECDKPYLIKGAKLFIYISKYEGFGLPVIEAMMMGIPTITSNISSLPEIVGNAALKINPDDSGALNSSIERLLRNSRLYEEMRQAGIDRASSFTWSKTAKQTLNVYYESDGKKQRRQYEKS